MSQAFDEVMKELKQMRKSIVQNRKSYAKKLRSIERIKAN